MKHNETQYTLTPLNIMWHLTTKNKVILNHCSQKLSENKDWPLEKETKSKSIFCLMKCLISNQIFSGILPLHIFDGNH